MGDEENRMPKNARREKNSKKESERERERKKKEKQKERERAARERTAIQYGETLRLPTHKGKDMFILYLKVPATYIYIYVSHHIYIHLCNARLEKQRDAKGNQFVGDGSSMTAHGKNPCPRDHLQ